MRCSDWSSDVCSSDLKAPEFRAFGKPAPGRSAPETATSAPLRVLLAAFPLRASSAVRFRETKRDHHAEVMPARSRFFWFCGHSGRHVCWVDWTAKCHMSEVRRGGKEVCSPF